MILTPGGAYNGKTLREGYQGQIPCYTRDTPCGIAFTESDIIVRSVLYGRYPLTEDLSPALSIMRATLIRAFK